MKTILARYWWELPRDARWNLAGAAIGLIAMAALFLLFGCDDPPDYCEPEAVQCEGSVIEVCNDGQIWETVVDCHTVDPGPQICCDIGGVGPDCYEKASCEDD